MQLLPLYYATFFANGGAVLLGLVRYKKLSTPLRLLVALLVYWFAVSFAEEYTRSRNIHNLWIGQINNVVEMVFFGYIYYAWRVSKQNGLFIVASIVLFLVGWGIAKFTFEPITGGDDITWALSRSIQIVICTYLLLATLRSRVEIGWHKDPKILISAGFIFYAAATFLLFSLFTPMLNASLELLRVIFQINWIANIVTYVIFGWAAYNENRRLQTIE